MLISLSSSLQIIKGDKEVVITNDGATIVKTMAVKHPAAKMVCFLSASLFFCLFGLVDHFAILLSFSWLHTARPNVPGSGC